MRNRVPVAAATTSGPGFRGGSASDLRADHGPGHAYCGVPEQTPEERGREALRNFARTWLVGAGASALEHVPAVVEARPETIEAIEAGVDGLLAPLKALCAVDDEAAEALGVLLYKASKTPTDT
jgi:hypothetical protein